MEHISEEHFLFPQAPPTHPKHIQLIQGIFHTSPLTSRKFSRYNIHRDSISDAVFCGYGGIGRRARFRFWWETVQVQVLLTALLKSSVFTGINVNTELFLILKNNKSTNFFTVVPMLEQPVWSCIFRRWTSPCRRHSAGHISHQ